MRRGELPIWWDSMRRKPLFPRRPAARSKRIKAVHTEFQRLTKDDQGFRPDLRVFLSHAYNLKAIADYETGPGAGVSGEQAIQALAQAERFVAHLETLLG
jgi:uncharacterized protein (UPF0332 family)